MPIKPSPSTETRALIAALGTGSEFARETAVARLAVIGGQAVDRLIAAFGRASREARIDVLRALERIGDPRALAVARRALADGGDVALAGILLLRVLLDSADSANALDALVAAALERSGERRVRLAAVDALRDMPPDIRKRVEAALEPELGRLAPDPEEAVWQDALEGRLPDDPALLREAVAARSATAPLGMLQKLIDAARLREQQAKSPALRAGWMALRGSIHQALALRGSRVALYDLRETLAEGERAMPSAFISALHALGDESCLEPIGLAWSRAGRDAARHQLAAAFTAIVRREKISRRSGVLRRVLSRWPELDSSR